MDAVSSVADNYEQFLVAQADLYHTPIGGTFELLPTCNLKCSMCYIRQSWEEVQKKGGLRPVEFWERIITEAVEQGLLYVLFTGGEPLIYPGFRELYEKIAKLPVYIVINTNATLLTEEIVQWLQKNKPRRINISLYGGSNETYEKLCGMKDGFDRVIAAFELLKKYDISFKVHSVLVPENIKDYHKIIDICNQFGVSLQMSNYMFPPYRREKYVDYEKHRLTAEEAAEINYQYAKDSHAMPGEFSKYIQENLEYMASPEKDIFYGCDQMSCRGGVSAFWVNWRGEISPCGIMHQGAVDLQNHSFEEAWEKVWKYRDGIKISAKCSTCEKRKFCPVCAAAAYCETGSTDGTPEYTCRFCEKYTELLKAGEK